MVPLAQVSLESKEHIDQERNPNLPAHRVGVVPQEISKLQGLFQLFEEDLDLPSAPIKIGHRLRAPIQVVG